LKTVSASSLSPPVDLFSTSKDPTWKWPSFTGKGQGHLAG
jgi:hypothetical protein